MIKLSTFRAVLAQYAGWTYAPGKVRDCRYPVPIPGVRTRTGPPNQADCVTFIEGLAVGAAAIDGFEGWSWDLHQQMMINTPDRFGPVTALVAAGLADHVPAGEAPPAGSVVHGWHHGGDGHTWFVEATDGDLVLPLECAKSLGGVCRRGVGPVVEPVPPDGWQAGARTWHSWLRVYPEIQVCALRLVDVDSVLSLGSPLPERWPEGGGSVRA